MSSADEILQMNTLHGTNIVTSSAARTLIIINCGEIILYLDCSLGTGLLTLHTADTAVGASLTGYSSLIVAGALNNNTGGVVNHMNYAVGTGLSTERASDTLGRIDLCNAVFTNVNCVVGTYGNTVTVAKTSEGTLGIAGVRKLSSLTGLDTVVNVLSVLCLALTVTSNVSYLCSNVTCSEANDLTDLLCNVGTTGDTEAGVIALALTESLCITVTTRVTAGTAVCTGKAITNSNNLLIFLNCKECSRNSKNYSTNECDNYKNN